MGLFDYRSVPIQLSTFEEVIGDNLTIEIVRIPVTRRDLRQLIGPGL
jgi:hypothetical protein